MPTPSPFHHGPEPALRLQTERLVLEPFRPDDAADLFAWASDEQTTRYMGWPRHRTLADAEAVLRIFDKHSLSQPPNYQRPLVFRDRASGRPLGSGGIHQAGPDGVELGWILRPDARRQGYAHEAAAALFHHALTRLDWARQVEVRVHPDNATSIRLALKLGLAPWEDCYFNMPQLGGERTRLLRFGVSKG